MGRGCVSNGDSDPLVFVIDDDVDMRNSLANLFLSVGLRVETFSCPTEFLQAHRVAVPGCILLDVRFAAPERSGLSFQREMLASDMHYPLVFHTGHGDVRMCAEAMKLGAVDFLLKPARDEDLLDAVRVGVERARNMFSEQYAVETIAARFSSLTAREREIFASVTNGFLNKQIAARLGISEVTVKVHRGHVMHKMLARSVVDLVRMSDKLAPLQEKELQSSSAGSGS
jgi:FixJ family two-component response regulator